MKPHVCALVGAQFGSEGKGTIAYEIAWDYDVHVRVGAPNAGHTIRHLGQTFKMRSIPCGWVNPDAWLVIGAGALIDVDLLLEEIAHLESFGYEIRSRLLIDRKAQILLPDYQGFEGGTEGMAHKLIGSTGEGVGPARMAKIARGTVHSFPFDVFAQAWLYPDLVSAGLQVVDTVEFLNRRRLRYHSVLLEGTQGQGLSLTHGEWPFCTSTDCGAAQMLADTGIPPMALERVILVARTYPIRVAGNSGPLEDETTWEAIGQQPEQTTVTLKTRRVGGWDPELVYRSVLLNGATEIALTFADYLDPAATSATTSLSLPVSVQEWIADLEQDLDLPVTMVGVGGPDFRVLRR